MKKTLLTFLSAAGFAFAVEAAWSPAQADQLGERLEAGRSQHGIPGMVVALVRDDRILYLEGFGEAAEGVPMTPDTLIPIASNTKAFTTTALGLAVEAGMLSWEERLVDLWPEFRTSDPSYGALLTLRDSVSHRSGLPVYGGDLAFWGANVTRKEMLRRIEHVPFTFPPRTGYAYCNLLFVVAGEILGSMDGTSWEQVVRERVLNPLGMDATHTTLGEALASGLPMAKPHTRQRGMLEAIPYTSIDAAAAAGSLVSTARDYTRWLQFQLDPARAGDGGLASPTLHQTLRTPVTLAGLPAPPPGEEAASHFRAYGLGWFLRDWHGYHLVEHGGGIDGFFSATAFLPHENLGVAVFTNLDHHPFARQALEGVLLMALRGELPDFTPPEAESKAEPVDAVQPGPTSGVVLNDRIPAGFYFSPVAGMAEIRSSDADGTLSLTLHDHPGKVAGIDTTAFPAFGADWDDPIWHQSRGIFQVNEHGAITGFEIAVRPDWIDSMTHVFALQESGIEDGEH